jgi:hypothetical protein
MAEQPLSPWPVIQDYLAGRELFEAAAARLAALLHQLESPAPPPPPVPAPATVDASRLAGQMVWIPLDSVPEADRAKATELLKRAFALMEDLDGEAA